MNPYETIVSFSWIRNGTINTTKYVVPDDLTTYGHTIIPSLYQSVILVNKYGASLVSSVYLHFVDLRTIKSHSGANFTAPGTHYNLKINNLLDGYFFVDQETQIIVDENFTVYIMVFADGGGNTWLPAIVSYDMKTGQLLRVVWIQYTNF